MDSAVADQLLQSLEKQLGPTLLAAYTLPPEGDGYVLRDRFEPALLLLFASEADIHAAREALAQLQINWAERLTAPPFVFTPSTLVRHGRLFPLFHNHLAVYGQRLLGQLLPLEGGGKPHAVERLAFLISEAIAASAALVPAHAGDDALRRLRRLAQQLSGKESEEGDTPAELFARVQLYLRLIVDTLPALAQHRAPLIKSTGEPNLLALYEDEQRLLAVIPPLSFNLLQRINWPALAGSMAGHLTAINVASSDQFYLMIQAQRPFDFFLKSFRRLWGADLLNGLTVAARAVFRQAARKPAGLLAAGVLGDYLLASSAKDVHRIIHDYQNRLLNIRLEQELLCRLRQIPLSEPPTPLPMRDEPLAMRIDAIVEHFNWWSDHYLQQMDARPADEKLAPP